MNIKQKLYLPLKRLIAIIGSFVGIFFCFALFWWWIIPVNFVVTHGHPFFARHRIGRNGKPFRCLKFRTMRNDVDPHMSSLDNRTKSATTKFGNFLRITSLDETLQLFNIFIGQMSFVGPRPLVDVNDVDLKTINLRKENGSIKILPGLTGYAQLHDRSSLGPEEKAKFDKYYFDNFSLWFDIKIFVKTIFKSFCINKK